MKDAREQRAREVMRQIHDILWNDWDPIGVGRILWVAAVGWFHIALIVSVLFFCWEVPANRGSESGCRELCLKGNEGSVVTREVIACR
ncbi:MAG: hypothetical protein ACYTBJ_22040 [Planctomycetota bacterium]|jgi:hypothetical protein